MTPPQCSELIENTRLLSESSTPISRAEAAALIPGINGQKVIVVPAAMIIMAGVSAWKVITNNRPSADLNTSYASAIPGFDFNWDEMSSWKKTTREYRFTVDHWLQGRAVDITYEVTFYHGPVSMPGTGKIRKGHYIANLTVKPKTIDLEWGWKIGLNATMSHPMNIGTSEEPLAMLTADLRWQYSKPLSTSQEIGIHTISVDGLGLMKEQNYSELDIAPVAAGRSAGNLPAIKWD